MKDRARTLRREFGKRVRGRGKRFPEALKRRVVAWALEQRRADSTATWEQLGAQILLRGESLRRWCIAGREGGQATQTVRSLVPVRVADSTTRTVSVVSPGGYRVEGLTLPEAAAVLRAVG